ncbi:cleavage polyadenylation factor subunit fip1, partial [Coemansia sp. RSA 2603]
HGGENSAGQTNSTNPTTTGGTDGQGDSIDDGNKSKSGDGGIQALFAGGVDRMDVLTVPLLQGMDMYTIDVDMLEEKPWRLPGADVTDYFNFGFSEETWKLYCMKQKEIRAYYNIHKMLPPGMMMMPGVAPGMPMGNPAMYPNMMNPAFRPGMPGNMYPPGADPKDGNQNRGPNALNPAQQQQMRMGMPVPMNPGFYPGMAGAQRNMPMGNMPPQMQMGNRGPMPPNHGQQNINQRLSQNPSHRHGSGDNRDNDQGSESGRSSRMGGRRDRSTSVHQSRNRDEDRNESRSRRDHDRERDHDKDRRRERDRERDREHGRDSNRADRDRGGDSEAKRSERRSDRGRERDSKDKSSRDGRDGRSS